MARHCSVRGCYERVPIDERLCSSHAIGMSPAVERSLQIAERRTKKATDPKSPRKVVESGPMVPLHVSWRYRYAGVTPRMLDWWRRKGWLGRFGDGSGYQYDWDDPAVMFQCRWLAHLNQAGHELEDSDAEGGFDLQRAGAEYAVKVEGGLWEPADEALISRLVDRRLAFTVARVPALAPSSSVGSDGSPRPITGGDGAGAETVTDAGEPNTPRRRRNVPAATGTDGV